MHACSVTSVVSESLQSYRLWPAKLLLSLGFSRQEYWSGSFPPPSYFPNLTIEHVSSVSPTLQADCLPTEPPLGKALLADIILRSYNLKPMLIILFFKERLNKQVCIEVLLYPL